MTREDSFSSLTERFLGAIVERNLASFLSEKKLQKELVIMYIENLPASHIQPALAEDVARDKDIKYVLSKVMDKARKFSRSLDRDRIECCKPARAPRDQKNSGAGSASRPEKRKRDQTDDELWKKNHFQLLPL